MFFNLFSKSDAKADAPASDLLFSKDVVLYGTEYPSAAKKNVYRQTIISKTKEGSMAQFCPCKIGNKPNYLVLNQKKFDLGVLAQPFATYLLKTYKDLVIYGQFIKLDGIIAKVHADFYGTYNSDYDFFAEDPEGYDKEYKYNIDNPDGKFFNLPAYKELNASIKQTDDGFDVSYGRIKIGSITDKRTKGLHNMLASKDCTITIINHPADYNSFVQMILRYKNQPRD